MIKKLSKKMVFRGSLVLSSLVALFFNVTVDKQDGRQHITDSLDIPLGSIEKAYATDGGGDCSGSSSDGGIAFPSPQASGIGIIFVAPTTESYTCGGCGGGGGTAPKQLN